MQVLHFNSITNAILICGMLWFDPWWYMYSEILIVNLAINFCEVYLFAENVLVGLFFLIYWLSSFFHCEKTGNFNIEAYFFVKFDLNANKGETTKGLDTKKLKC